MAERAWSVVGWQAGPRGGAEGLREKCAERRVPAWAEGARARAGGVWQWQQMAVWQWQQRVRCSGRDRECGSRQQHGGGVDGGIVVEAEGVVRWPGQSAG